MTRKVHRLRFVMALLLLAWIILVGCGGAGRADSTDNETQAIQIAAAYGRDGDIQKAAARLAELDVPNERQFLALLTERYIAEGRDAAVTGDLVRLSRDLGLVTVAIAQYGEMVDTVAASSSTPTPSAPAVTGVVTTAMATPGIFVTPLATPTATGSAALRQQPTDTPVLEPPTATPTSVLPRVRADYTVNVRAGPGTNHPVLSTLQANEEIPVTGRNADGSWWQVCCVGRQRAWIAASVVQGLGDMESVAVVTDIPTPPPLPTPTPPLQLPPQQSQPSPTPFTGRTALDFRIIEQRMLSNVENGGSFDGDSLHCGLGHTIYVKVVDAAGNPLDGIIVRGIYFGDLPVTGSKGPGMTMEDLYAGGGDELIVDRDLAGRRYASEKTRGLVNRTRDISIVDYIAGGYCRDEAECQDKINNNQLCEGHYSYSVIFQRTW